MKWEYLVKVFDLAQVNSPQKELNDLGDECWEIIDIQHTSNCGVRYHFKRPKQQCQVTTIKDY